MQEVQKTKLRISSRAAVFLQPGTPRAEKIKAAQGEIPLTTSDLIAVLLYLSRDPDNEVKEYAITTLQSIDQDSLVDVCSNPDTHPLILHILARFHFRNAMISERIALHPNTDVKTRTFLCENGAEAPNYFFEPSAEDEPGKENSGKKTTVPEVPLPCVGQETEEDTDELKSKFKLSRELGITEKIKMALTGDKEWRSLLIKDSNKLISESVLKNPRITEQEILHICNSSLQNDEILRIICKNREWTKNYSIRKALIENHRTPLQYALRFLSFLGEKDLAFMARNKNVSSIITTQARRMLINKNHGKK